MNKKIIIIISSIIALGFTTHKIIVNSKNNKIKNLENKVFEMQENAKKENKRIRDSAYNSIDNISKNAIKRIDTIIKTVTKFVPYEKYIYANRNVNTAIDVLSKYQYDTISKKTPR